MPKNIVNISMSLDGFITGPNVSAENPLGTNGELLHDWFFSKKTLIDDQIQKEIMKSYGSVIIGNHIYTTAIDTGWNGTNPFDKPTFILAHRAIKKAVKGFTYVHDGIESALSQAKKAANEKDVWIMGGANIIQQYLKAGLVDEMQIHIASILLGSGTRLFDLLGENLYSLKKIEVTDTPAAVHIRYQIEK